MWLLFLKMQTQQTPCTTLQTPKERTRGTQVPVRAFRSTTTQKEKEKKKKEKNTTTKNTEKHRQRRQKAKHGHYAQHKYKHRHAIYTAKHRH